MILRNFSSSIFSIFTEFFSAARLLALFINDNWHWVRVLSSSLRYFIVYQGALVVFATKLLKENVLNHQISKHGNRKQKLSSSFLRRRLAETLFKEVIKPVTFNVWGSIVTFQTICKQAFTGSSCL